MQSETALQRLQPVIVGGRTLGKRQRTDIHPDGQRRQERQQCAGQPTCIW
jgi:hypothetical protein